MSQAIRVGTTKRKEAGCGTGAQAAARKLVEVSAFAEWWDRRA